VRIRLDVQNLLLASWETDRGAVGRVVPPGVQPAEVEGRHLVSIVSFHVRRGRVGRVPVLPFSQLNLRTYVTWKDEPAVLFLASRVTSGGLPGLLLGAPYRSARLRVKAGRVRAPGLGVDIGYRPGEPADPGELGRHELGIFESAGLKAIRIERSPAEWRSAESLAPATAHLLLAYGFVPRDEPELVYTAETSFVTEPAKKLA
jgi:Uncharacterized conserved protein (COG2071)